MARLKTKFDKFISDPKRRQTYERESLAFDAAELISSLMEKQAVTKSDLAVKVGVSKSHITQLLNGSRNMTMHSLADLAFALGHKVELESAPLQDSGSSDGSVTKRVGATSRVVCPDGVLAPT